MSVSRASDDGCASASTDQQRCKKICAEICGAVSPDRVRRATAAFGSYLHVVDQIVVEGTAAAEAAKEVLETLAGNDLECCLCCFELCAPPGDSKRCYCIITIERDEPDIPGLVGELHDALPHLRQHIHPHYVLTALPDAQWEPIAQPGPQYRPQAPDVRHKAPGARSGCAPAALAAVETELRVGVLDTGWFFDPNDEKDKRNKWVRDWFDGRLEYEGEVTPRKNGAELNPGDGHGPFAASVVLQVTPGVKVVGRPVHTSGLNHGFVTDCELAQALCRYKDVFFPDETGAGGVDVLNLSFGANTHHTAGTLPLTAQVLQSYFDWYFRHQDHVHGAERDAPPAIPRPIVVASAGNSGSSQPVYPAALPFVLGVGALDSPTSPLHPSVACWSNRGTWVQTYAPGSDVDGIYLEGSFTFDRETWSHDPEGERLQLPEGCARPGGPTQSPLDFNGWAMWQGTSFAAPFVAGVLCQYLASGCTAEEAVLRVQGTLTEQDVLA